MATLLDLARRGYLTVHETVTIRAGLFGEKRKADYRFDVTGRPLSEVDAFERDLVAFLVQHSDSPRSFTMAGITVLATKNRRVFRRWFRDWSERVRDRGRSFRFYEPYPAGAMVLNVATGVSILVIGVVLSIIVRAPVGLPAIIGGAIVAAMTPLLIRHTPEGRRLYLAWTSFGAALTAKGPTLGPVSPDAHEWGRYLGLAVVMKADRKVLDRLLPADAAGRPVPGGWYYGGHAHLGDGASALSEGVSSTVASMSSAMSSASGAGGGASGGGGGGGGVGGGGAG